MIVHFIVISIQCAALAAFLIIWYSWARKKIEIPVTGDDNDKILFPFRHFSWMLMGLVFVTCLLQIHFIRVSASVHEKLAAMSNFYTNHEQSIRSLDELKDMLEKLRRDIDANSRSLRAHAIARDSNSKLSEKVADLAVTNVDQVKTEALASLRVLRDVQTNNAFAKEAKASSPTPQPVHPSARGNETPRQADAKAYSMRLSRLGRVAEDRLSVKKRPAANSPVVEQLAWGQEVKVTEKRQSNEEMWFRIVTPSGRSGWVDYRQVKLDGNS
ncbi:MAG: SH3 domain-containing protein [Desulfomonile tiedjei]|nr:SH3 domain-containing protein [Desulfomonile tiedjei]